MSKIGLIIKREYLRRVSKSHLSCSRSSHRFYSLHLRSSPYGSLPSREMRFIQSPYSTPPANTPRCSRIRKAIVLSTATKIWISTGKCRKRRYSHFSTSPTTCRKIEKRNPLFQETNPGGFEPTRQYDIKEADRE